jgi:hypothetical protein
VHLHHPDSEFICRGSIASPSPCDTSGRSPKADFAGSGRLVGFEKPAYLEAETRCGTKPCAFRMRCTEHTPMPAASVVAVSVQWVASWGGSVAVRATR